MNVKMNQEIKRQWLEDLRSGKFKQGKKSLRSGDDKFCCLGVLCDQAERAGVVSFIPSRGPGMYDDERMLLPDSVVKWAGLDRKNPVAGGKLLTSLNDNLEASFEQIADIIEKEL